MTDIPKLSDIFSSVKSPTLSKYCEQRPHSAVFKGLSGSGSAFLATEIFKQTKTTILILAENGKRAERLYNDCSTILGSDENLALLPSRDAVPYNMKSPFGPTTEARLGTLAKLLSGRPQLVVAPAAALLQRLVPGRKLFNSVIHIEAGIDSPIDRLAQWLTDGGFRRESQTTDLGTFSIRGGILDVYPFLSENPYRIEFWGDTVESIRSFNVFTQKSIAVHKSIEIVPMREFCFSEEQIDAAIERMEECADNSDRVYRGASQFGIENNAEISNTSDVVQKIDLNAIRKLEHQWKTVGDLEGIEWFLHWFDIETVSVLDYLKNDSVVIWDDVMPMERRFDETRENYRHHIERVPEIFAPLVSPSDKLLFGDEAIFEQLSFYDNVFVDTVDFPKDTATFNMSFSPRPPLQKDIDLIINELRKYADDGYRCVITCPNVGYAERMGELLGNAECGMRNAECGPCLSRRSEAKPIRNAELTSTSKDLTDYRTDKYNDIAERINICTGALHDGFICNEIKLLVYTDDNFSGGGKDQRRAAAKTRRKKSGMPLAAFDQLAPQDIVVHEDHGIGRFIGVERIKTGDSVSDCMVIFYAERAKVYVPIEDFHKVQKYIGKDGSAPVLSKLGTASWDRLKERTRASLREMAQELIDLYAKRQFLEGISHAPDNIWQKEFEDSFIYEETPDQLQAVKDIKSDMETGKPMDRLVCGDVGFGKTEVAMRAAFKAVMSGYQVAVLAPTTILAAQHANTFSERMANFPVRIELMSRFRTAKEQKISLEKLAAGEADILIGTHRILSKDIKFKNLGLLIIDEEQRFGVKHKEALRQFRYKIDTLSMTATPIPRTLHMSLVGARDLSIINTPPRNRLPIETRVAEYHDELVKSAIENELERGGQVYFVNNRIKNIPLLQDNLERLVPRAKIISAHGQMDEGELEPIMKAFIAGQYDILLSTVIIENGLDIPNVNTIIVHNADKLGLSQLYQLRGRVGRSSEQAYAYFLTPNFKTVSEDSLKRLKALEQYTDLGSGFQIAMRDLEIRGAGNILGNQQHGFIAAVGFEMYCRLLQEAVDEIRGQADGNKTPILPETRLDVPMQAYIPTEYIADGSTRISVYQEMSALRTIEELAETERGLSDRFGPMPESVKALVLLMKLKILGRLTGCSKISIAKDGTLDLFIHGDEETAKDRIKQFFESTGENYRFEISYDDNAQARLRTELCSETGGMVMLAQEVAGILEGVA